MLPEIILYTTLTCPYCVRAKDLLERKAVKYHEVDVTDDQTKRDEMVQKSHGKRTVPQIFIDGKHIGGCDDLYELERKGELDKLLHKQS